MPYSPGTNTGHGHVWKRPDGVRARCGGPGMCRSCAGDKADMEKASERQSFSMDRHVELMEYAAKLEAALRDARAAIASLPEDALGMAGVTTGDFLFPQSHEWPIRDELLAKIDAALSKV